MKFSRKLLVGALLAVLTAASPLYPALQVHEDQTPQGHPAQPPAKNPNSVRTVPKNPKPAKEDDNPASMPQQPQTPARAVAKSPKPDKEEDDPGLMERLKQTGDQYKRQQAENERRERKLEVAKATSSLPPQKIKEVDLKIQALKASTAATAAFLARPLPATKVERELYLKNAFGGIAETRKLESVIAKELGVHPSPNLEVMENVLSKLGEGEIFKTKYGGFNQEVQAYNPDPNAPVALGPNTQFFGIAAQLPPSAIPAAKSVAAYTPTTVQAAAVISLVGHGAGGGIMLEGTADGLGHVSSVEYDGSVNALVLNSDLVYFVKIPPWSLATMCREIGTDRNALLGVSETVKEGLVFGDRPEIYKHSDVAYDLMLADKFLADVVFAPPHAWTEGYKFPATKPVGARITSDMLVRFAFGNFQFARNDGLLSVVSSSLEVRMLPVSKVASPAGQMLPNYNALDQGWTPPDAFVANARILTEHIDYFRREPLIENVFAYGEVAALLRSLKESGRNLNALADQIETGEPR